MASSSATTTSRVLVLARTWERVVEEEEGMEEGKEEGKDEKEEEEVEGN